MPREVGARWCSSNPSSGPALLPEVGVTGPPPVGGCGGRCLARAFAGPLDGPSERWDAGRGATRMQDDRGVWGAVSDFQIWTTPRDRVAELQDV